MNNLKYNNLAIIQQELNALFSELILHGYKSEEQMLTFVKTHVKNYKNIDVINMRNNIKQIRSLIKKLQSSNRNEK